MTAQTNLVDEMVGCLEMHQDYELDGGFTEPEFIDWVMEGIGADMENEGHERAAVLDAASQAYARMSPRFRR